jgi:phosphotransferase system  glucose/maltose/N-acetylglucosamine-specific IIC component
VAGPDAWHAWRDDAMRRQHEFINEFEPFTNSLQHSGPLTLLARFGLLPLLLPLALALAVSGTLRASTRAALLAALGTSLITAAMIMVQVRWAGLLSTALACLALAVLKAGSEWLGPARGRAWILGAGYAAIVAPMLVFFAIGVGDNLKRRDAGALDGTLAWTIASRDLAFNLKRLAQMGPVRVMSGPGQTPALHFFGDVRGTAALYWENTTGVREAAVFFADQGDEEAQRIARERGITHVVLQQDTTLAESSVRIALGSDDPELIKQSLAYRLCDPLGEIPPWLEPVPYYGSPMAAGFQMRVLKVRSDKLAPPPENL